NWWETFKKKGEKQVLINGVAAGDYNSIKQARRLASKYPESAVAAIRQGVKNAKDNWICGDLVRIVTQLKDEAATAFLQEQLHGTYLLSRVAAARGLFDRGHEEVV